MTAVKVSSRYSITIPKEIRDAAGIRPGQRFHIYRFGDQIELVPVRPMEEMRGFLKGIDTTVERDEDRV